VADRQANVPEAWFEYGPLPQFLINQKETKKSSLRPQICLRFTAITSARITCSGDTSQTTGITSQTTGIQAKPTPAAGSWSNLAHIPAQPTNRLEVLSDSAGSSRFYRIVTPRQP
jgi:hypothetical protein